MAHSAPATSAPASALRLPAALLALAGLLALGACAGGGDEGPDGPAPADPGAPGAERPGAPADAEDLPPAPWSGDRLRPTRVPRVLLQQWAEADNRRTCALIAPRTVDPAEAEPRAATFAGGWGVAWDLPDLRSAFGVAGTGVEPDASTYDDWPHRIRWADGSRVGYGPEGGTGPNQLAYLRVAGERCLYNVWSRLGPDHLERLLAELRFVMTP